jgi:hypothetical protein
MAYPHVLLDTDARPDALCSRNNEVLDQTISRRPILGSGVTLRKELSASARRCQAIAWTAAANPCQYAMGVGENLDPPPAELRRLAGCGRHSPALSLQSGSLPCPRTFSDSSSCGLSGMLNRSQFGDRDSNRLHKFRWKVRCVFPGRAELEPREVDGVIECWLKPADASANRPLGGAAHCDFWRTAAPF